MTDNERKLTVDNLPKHDNSLDYYEGSKQVKYKPFEPKAKEDMVGFKRRKDKWENQDEDDSIDHRRFNTTLHPKQILTAFKRGIHKGEYKQEDLITTYRVVLGRLLADPDLSDDDFMGLYKVIQSRASEVYSRRSKRLKRIR